MRGSDALRALLKDECDLHKAASLIAARGDRDAELRLFAVRCVRQVQSLMPSPYLSEMIDAAERYALGEISSDEARELYGHLVHSLNLLSELQKQGVSCAAFLGVSAVASLFHDTPSVATDTAEAVRELVKEVEKTKPVNAAWQAHEQMLSIQLQDFEAMFCQAETVHTRPEPVVPCMAEGDGEYCPRTSSPQAFDSILIEELDAAWLRVVGEMSWAGNLLSTPQLRDSALKLTQVRQEMNLVPLSFVAAMS